MHLFVVFLIMIHQCTFTIHLKLTLVTFDRSPPICQNLLGGYEMLRKPLHSLHIKICGLNLNTYMACAGL